MYSKNLILLKNTFAEVSTFASSILFLNTNSTFHYAYKIIIHCTLSIVHYPFKKEDPSVYDLFSVSRYFFEKMLFIVNFKPNFGKIPTFTASKKIPILILHFRILV
jgi:hypothetical protein